MPIHGFIRWGQTQYSETWSFWRHSIPARSLFCSTLRRWSKPFPGSTAFSGHARPAYATRRGVKPCNSATPSRAISSLHSSSLSSWAWSGVKDLITQKHVWFPHRKKAILGIHEPLPLLTYGVLSHIRGVTRKRFQWDQHFSGWCSKQSALAATFKTYIFRLGFGCVTTWEKNHSENTMVFTRVNGQSQSNPSIVCVSNKVQYTQDIRGSCVFWPGLNICLPWVGDYHADKLGHAESIRV